MKFYNSVSYITCYHGLSSTQSDDLFLNFYGEKPANHRYSKGIHTASNSVLFMFCELF